MVFQNLLHTCEGKKVIVFILGKEKSPPEKCGTKSKGTFQEYLPLAKILDVQP